VDAPAPDPAAPASPTAGSPTRRDALGLALGLALVVLACAGLALVARGPCQAAGEGLVRALGPGGVLVGVVLAEASPVPLAGEPLLYLGLQGGLAPGLVAGLGCAGNLLAAVLCYPCGLALRRLGLVERVLGARRAEAEAQVRRHGAWALVLASFSPLPFGTLAWVAGALRMPLGPYALACLSRVPKVLLYLAAMEGGSLLAR
jgi:membrane protein YqaA with SNARE-associated domain